MIDAWSEQRAQADNIGGIKVLFGDFEEKKRRLYSLSIWSPQSVEPDIHHVFESKEAREGYILTALAILKP